MEKFLFTLVGAIIGFISGLLAPWIKWQIEKRQERDRYRRELVKCWRNAINVWNPDTEVFGDTAEYASLRGHMCHEIVKKFEAPRTLYMAGGRGESVLKHFLLDEVTRIEKEWKLV